MNTTTPVRVDLVTASAWGLDRQIPPGAATTNTPRSAAARRISPSVVTAAIARSTKGRTFGILGEPRVNVLEVNLRLDGKLK
jgi:K+-transporting ATPase ATPase C chain